LRILLVEDKSKLSSRELIAMFSKEPLGYIIDPVTIFKNIFVESRPAGVCVKHTQISI
jgi:hypothetical protein